MDYRIDINFCNYFFLVVDYKKTREKLVKGDYTSHLDTDDNEQGEDESVSGRIR